MFVGMGKLLQVLGLDNIWDLDQEELQVECEEELVVCCFVFVFQMELFDLDINLIIILFDLVLLIECLRKGLWMDVNFNYRLVIFNDSIIVEIVKVVVFLCSYLDVFVMLEGYIDLIGFESFNIILFEVWVELVKLAIIV